MRTLQREAKKPDAPTVAELAEYTEISEERLGELMAGAKPTLKEIVSIADFYDYDPLLFLGGL